MMSHDASVVLTLVIFVVSNIPTRVTSSSHPLDDPDTTSINDHPKKDDLLRVLETSFLNIFGQKNRPKPASRLAIPDFMLELYDTVLDDPYLEDASSMVKGRGLAMANTARSFYHKELKRSDECTAPLCHRLWFDVKTIPRRESLTDAELRIFKDVAGVFDSTNLNMTGNSSSRNNCAYKVEIHEIMKPRGNDVETISRLIDVKTVTMRKSSWHSFDVFPAVDKWRTRSHLNHGIEVRLVPGKCSHSSSSTHHHIRLKRSASLEKDTWNSQRPILVTYTNDERTVSSRKKRASKRRRRKNRRRNRKNRKKSTQCRRHALYVDFQDVQWDDWIVAPSGYQAYYCQGECDFPLADHLNATNHAIVQTLVNSVKPSAVPKPCCVPTELSPISMLYRDEYDEIVLKNYQDMVVEGCGCR